MYHLMKYVWIRKTNLKKVLLAGLLFLVISFLIRQVEVVFTMKYYLMPEYFGLWSKLMMPGAGPPPPEFMFLSMIFTFLTGAALAAIYDFIKDILPKKYWQRVVTFTDMTGGLYLVFSIFTMYLLFNIPLGLLVSWFISGFLSILLGTAVFAKLFK